MKKLDFDVIKSREKFLDNYQSSDKAAEIGDALLRKHGFEPVPFGEDRRNERVWEAGKDKPDRKIFKNGHELALLDWKGKNGDYWMINERAYRGYLEWAASLGLPVYVAIWSFKSNDGKYIKLPPKSIMKKEQWDNNIVVEFHPEEMQPWNDLPQELETLQDD